MAELPTIGTRHVRPQSGEALALSTLGLETAPLGNRDQAISETQARATLEAAWEAGIRYFDTAPLYGLGLAETRLNGFLRDKRKDPPVLSTKVGRLLAVCPPELRAGQGQYFDVPMRREIFDYSYDGVMRSLENSFERLGVDAIDIVYCHDMDVFTHGSHEAAERRISEFIDGGFRALRRLREGRAIKAIGAAVSAWQACQILANQGDFDVFLLNGRYSLLHQEALETFLPLCEARDIGVVIGDPYNSGILATGPRPGAVFDDGPAPPDVLARAERLRRVSRSHGVALAEAALAFPLGHPCVVSVIPGAQSPDEVRRNVVNLRVKIPAALWSDLKTEGLLRADAPTPL